MPVHHKIESPIFYDHYIKLDQLHTFESPIDKLASSHFYEIEHNKDCDFDPQICDPVQIPESILTLISLPNMSNILESVWFPYLSFLNLNHQSQRVTFRYGEMNVD